MSITIAEKAPYWGTLIGSELERMEVLLQETVQSEIDAARIMSLRLFNAGGKRLRSALVILSALSVDPDGFTDDVAGMAAAIELLHAASLIHDDVVDDGRMRRGLPTANTVYGNRISVLGGDYMLSRCLALVGTHGDMTMLRDIADTATFMAECEVLQAMCTDDIDMWAKHYMSIIEGKTAALLSTGCRCGARLSGASSHFTRQLSIYSKSIGIAFQITDDILDVIGDPRVTGKSVCADLSQGKYTLPVLVACGSKDPRVRERINEILVSGAMNEQGACEAAAFLVECGAVDSARDTALDYVASAISNLSGLPHNMYKDALEELASHIVDRLS